VWLLRRASWLPRHACVDSRHVSRDVVALYKT
jgi:hypothetical protein